MHHQRRRGAGAEGADVRSGARHGPGDVTCGILEVLWLKLSIYATMAIR